MIECEFNELKTNEIGEGLVILNDLNFIENHQFILKLEKIQEKFDFLVNSFNVLLLYELIDLTKKHF
jgi:hypothetical protein